ncbi:hypothetical protein BD779DRAFT_1557031 [Infundibulicybe gibba]|nr:hypothetical protein BD779DRAFT_1557031 [Infundibulicybe gibba]
MAIRHQISLWRITLLLLVTLHAHRRTSRVGMGSAIAMLIITHHLSGWLLHVPTPRALMPARPVSQSKPSVERPPARIPHPSPGAQSSAR